MRMGAQIGNGSGAREAPRPKGESRLGAERTGSFSEQKEALLFVVQIGNESGLVRLSGRKWGDGTQKLRTKSGRWERAPAASTSKKQDSPFLDAPSAVG